MIDNLSSTLDKHMPMSGRNGQHANSNRAEQEANWLCGCEAQHLTGSEQKDKACVFMHAFACMQLCAMVCRTNLLGPSNLHL